MPVSIRFAARFRAAGCILLLALALQGQAPAQGRSPADMVREARSLRRTDLDRAAQMIRQALQEARFARGSVEHIDLLLLDADIISAQGRFHESQAQAQLALGFAEALGDPVRRGQALRHLGRVSRNLGEYVRAMEFLGQAEALFQGREDRVEWARCLEEKALVLRRLGDLTRSLEHLFQAQEIFEAKGVADLQAMTCNNLGLLQRELGLKDEAWATFQAGVRLCEAKGFTGSLSILSENMGEMLMQQGRFEEARELLDRSLKLQFKDKAWRNYSSTLLRLGQLQAQQGQLVEAERTFREGLKMKEGMQESYGVASALMQLGILELRKGRTQEAQVHLERAVRIARETQAQLLETQVLHELIRAYRATGQGSRALQAMERYAALQDQIHSEENRARLALLQNRLELQRREQEIQFLKRAHAEREADLRRIRKARNLILGTTGVALVLAAALYLRVRHGRRLLKALKESEARFRAFAEQAPVGVWIVQDGLIQYANREVANFLGTTPEALRGTPPGALLPERENPVEEVPARIVLPLEEGRTRVLEGYAGKLHVEGRPALLELFIDVTARREAELELARYRESLEERVDERTRELLEAHRELLMRERLSTLGRLTATVAHELRNPLGAIRSSLFTLGREEILAAEPLGRKALALAERSLLRCEGLIQELLSFSSPRPLTFHATELAAWMGELLVEYPFPEEVDVAWEAGPAVPVELDPERFRRAVMNVLENAVHAIQANPVGCGRLRISLAAEADQACLAFADSGIGVPEPLVARVFEPLFSTKSFGSGLGLAVVKEVVEGHGGTVTLESREGEGTTVRICLPMTEDGTAS